MVLITSCAHSKKTKTESLLEVVNIEINAWLDLMPGVSPGKFHLTGEVTLQNINDEEIKDISLTKITVYSSDDVVYSFKPYFTNKMEGNNFNLEKGITKVFRFGIVEGLKIDERIADNKIINIKLIFVSNKGSYSYSADSIQVEEAY
jgi:hypothetical protein